MKKSLLIVSSIAAILGNSIQATEHKKMAKKSEACPTTSNAKKEKKQQKDPHEKKAGKILKEIITENTKLTGEQKKKPGYFMKTNRGKELKATILEHVKNKKTAEEIKKDSTLVSTIKTAFNEYLAKPKK